MMLAVPLDTTCGEMAAGSGMGMMGMHMGGDVHD